MKPIPSRSFSALANTLFSFIDWTNDGTQLNNKNKTEKKSYLLMKTTKAIKYTKNAYIKIVLECYRMQELWHNLCMYSLFTIFRGFFSSSSISISISISLTRNFPLIYCVFFVWNFKCCKQRLSPESHRKIYRNEKLKNSKSIDFETCQYQLEQVNA